MRTGFNGYRSGCCCPFEVWGFSCKAPNLIPAAVLGGYNYFPSGDAGIYVLPDVDNYTSLIWSMSAAKVPSSYPYHTCRWIDLPPTSSADPNALCEDSWEVDLIVPAGERYEETVGETTNYIYGNIHNVLGSRVIFEDSEERYVTYSVSPQYVPFETGNARLPGWDSTANFKDHVQIDLATNTATLYNAEWIGEPPIGSSTVMEDAWVSTAKFNTATMNLGNISPPLNGSWMFPANCTYYGKDYFVFSTYKPGASDWWVGRLTYSGLVPFCNESLNPQSGAVGDFTIVLPSVRAYLLSSESQPDEPWVCAIDDITTPTKIVTGRWLNTDMRGLDPDPDLDVADGTLDASDVENTIIDTSDSGDPAVVAYPSEDWGNLEIRGYNHINGKDYMVFSSSGDPELVTLTADFEGGDLNSGLSGGLEFTAGGSYPGNTWLPDTGDAHGGTWSAKSNISALINSQADLKIDINPPAPNYLTFWYIHDNRYAGTRIPPFTELTNFPDPENTLEVFIDGALVPMDIWNGTGWDSYSKSKIDNINVPYTTSWDESHYLTWRQCRITVPAGLHTIRWSLFRRFACDNGHLYSYLDDIAFPEVTLHGDPASKRMWIYDGTEVIKVPKWAYPIRNDENEDLYADRTSPLPDFITADFDGNIYYGNPHYVAKLKAEDSSVDTDWAVEGIIRFSASPYISVPDGYYNSECEWVVALPGVAYDQIKDPPWGAFQILPTACGIQLRGVNGSIRDATHDPLDVAGAYPDQTFVRNLQGGSGWNRRIHGWTIDSTGTIIIPHLEVIWRPFEHGPSWAFEPEAGSPPYPTPPYSEYVESDGNDIPSWDDDSWWVDVHNPDRLSETQYKSRWTSFNHIISRVYGDSYDHNPQAKWTKNPAADPEPLDPDYGTYPWPSGQAAAFVAWHCPSQGHLSANVRLLPREQQCSVIVDETTQYYYVWDYEFGIGGISDFDAVYNACSSCGNCETRVGIDRIDKSA